MKSLIFIFLFLSFNLLSAQTYLGTIDSLKQINERTYKDSDSLILSKTGINILFAEEIAYFLSGSRDLSLYNSYFSTNSENNRLLIAYNFSIPKKQPNKYVKSILTIGAEADIKDGISNIVKNSEFTNNVGFRLKYTFLFDGKVNFISSQKMKFYNKRKDIIGKLNKEEIIPKEAVFKIIGNSSVVKDENKKLKKNTVEKFYAEEVSEFKKSNDYDSYRKTWLTLSLYFPLSNGKFSVIDESLTNLSEHKSWLLEGNFLINHFRKWPFLKTVGTIGFEYKNINSTISEENEKLTQATLQNFNNTILTSTSKTIYLGNFNEFFSPSFLVDIAIYPDFLFKNKNSPIGFSFEFNKTLKGMNSTFEQTVYKFGIPMSLKDKEGKPKINFEPQIAINDKDVFWRISIGLPFGSLLYE